MFVQQNLLNKAHMCINATGRHLYKGIHTEEKETCDIEMKKSLDNHSNWELIKLKNKNALQLLMVILFEDKTLAIKIFKRSNDKPKPVRSVFEISMYLMSMFQVYQWQLMSS